MVKNLREDTPITVGARMALAIITSVVLMVGSLHLHLNSIRQDAQENTRQHTIMIKEINKSITYPMAEDMLVWLEDNLHPTNRPELHQTIRQSVRDIHSKYRNGGLDIE